MSKEVNVCCICRKEYKGYGNNAFPVAAGRCCDRCNRDVVIPARYRSYIKSRPNNGNSK